MVATHGAGTLRGGRRTRRETETRRASWAPAAAVVLTIAVLAVSGSLPTPADLTATVSSTTRVRVSAADTMWSVASAHRPAGMSTAQAVDAIRRLNDFGPKDVLSPGQVIIAPSGEAVVSQLALR
jgi:Tfp pilus assembly protein FimV